MNSAADGGSSGRPELCRGAIVRIHGLKASTSLNGAAGTCERWDRGAARWSIRLASGDEKLVRPENLIPEALRPGASALIFGLQANPALNGTLGLCERWLPASGRWSVRLPSGEEKRVRPANVCLAEPGPDISVFARSDAAASLRRSYVTLACASRLASGGDEVDDFVVADAPLPGVTEGSGGASSPAPEAGPAALAPQPWTCPGAAEQGRRSPEGDEEGAQGQAGQEEGTKVAEGLACPVWLWEALHPHQQDGVRWLWDLHRKKMGGILADDLGLGKTIQMVAYLASLCHSGYLRGEGPRASGEALEDRIPGAGGGGVLVVCPVTLVQQWQKEFRVWYPRMEVRVLLQRENIQRREFFIAACSPQCVAITTYETLRAVGSTIVEAAWAVVILDEGQKIRNPDSVGTLAAKRVSTPHRIILTGSPVQSNLQELWSLVDFVWPGRLGTLPVFLEEIAKPIEAGFAAKTNKAHAVTAYQTAWALRELTGPCILRRTKGDVMEAVKLPHKQEEVLLCHLTLEQYAAYLGFLQTGQARRLRSGTHEPGQIACAISICRRLCNHPDLLGGTSDGEKDKWDFGRSGKMKVLAEVMRTWHDEGHRVLVFAQTTQVLEVIQHWMQKEGYTHVRMDGKTPVKKRVQLVEDFNTNASLYALISTTRIGGVGLNIVGANRVVLFDPDWNPRTDVQARERAWRIGQHRDVLVYRLLLAGTLEEKIYHRQMSKRLRSQQVLEDAGSEQGQCLWRGGLTELFALPPPPPDMIEEELAKLKEKYRLVFEKLGPQENTEDFQHSYADITEAFADLGVEAFDRGRDQASGDGNSALLQTLFDRGGIRASFSGDSVERLLVVRKTVRERAGTLTARAVAALGRSAQERASYLISEPTWTGKHGLAGAPPGAEGVQGTPAPSGSGSVAPSKRRRELPPEVIRAVERLVASRPPLPGPSLKLAEAIFAAFLDKDIAGTGHCLSTEQVLHHVAAGIAAEQRGAFKSLLQQTCRLSKSENPEEPAAWTLRRAFWPRSKGRHPGA